MHATRCYQPNGPSQVSSTHRARTLMVILVLGGGLSLILYTHGAWWWYAPLAVLAIVFAHTAILGGLVPVAMLRFLYLAVSQDLPARSSEKGAERPYGAVAAPHWAANCVKTLFFEHLG